MLLPDAISLWQHDGPSGYGIQSTPVNIIYWRADLPQPQNIVSGGPRPLSRKALMPASQNITHSQSWANGVWTVVMEDRCWAASVNQVSFVGGTDYYVALCQPRDGGPEGKETGVKMVTGNWHTLHVQ